MYEVEVKARLRNRQEVENKLKEFGCAFGEELHQVDRIFIPEGQVFPPPLGVAVLRVRRQNDIHFLTLKIPQQSYQDCVEREVEAQDGEKVVEIIKLLKYQQVPTVDKKRVKTKYKDIEIVLDTVEHLGEFIEAEKIVKSESQKDRKKTQEELFIFLETLGISKEDRVIDGKYDVMLYDKLMGK